MMRFECKTGAEKAWLAASATAFVLQRLLEVEYSSCGMCLLEGAMIILTFPFGTVAMLFLALLADALRGYANVSWLLDWSTLLFVGYIQWFWVLPEIRRSSHLITLNLTSPAETDPPLETVSPMETTSPVEIASPVKIASPAEIASPVAIASHAPPDESLTPPQVAPVAFDAAAFVPALAEFDEAGLTALDRVLRASPSTTASPVPPFHVETIFPAVR